MFGKRRGVLGLNYWLRVCSPERDICLEAAKDPPGSVTYQVMFGVRNTNCGGREIHQAANLRTAFGSAQQQKGIHKTARMRHAPYTIFEILICEPEVSINEMEIKKDGTIKIKMRSLFLLAIGRTNAE